MWRVDALRNCTDEGCEIRLEHGERPRGHKSVADNLTDEVCLDLPKLFLLAFGFGPLDAVDVDRTP